MAKGNRGGKRQNQGGGLIEPTPATLKDALGTKGSPMTEAEAWFNANPYYSNNYKEFSENCQRCVFAYEMRRRGYDVVAQPTYKGDTMPRAGNWKRAMSGMETVNVGGTRVNKTIDNIENQMAKWGEGSRAIIRIRWAGSNSGHVLNCEYTNGRLHVYDVQSNKRPTGKKYLENYLPYTTLKYTSLCRTDNATPTDDMRFMVRPSKK